MYDDESDLVSQAAEGDRVAIQRLLTRHHSRMVAAIECKVPADLQGVMSADDVCQEAYISVFQQIGSLRDRSGAAFAAWLRAIVDRKLVDAIRAMRAQKRGGGRQAGAGGPSAEVSSVIQLLDVVATHSHTPSRDAGRRELVDGVQQALDALKDDYREVLRLHYIEGKTVADTAKQMDRSPGAVVMLCKRALERLAIEIDDPEKFLSRGA